MSRITSIARGARRLVTANSPVILTGIAVVGVAATAILAAKASPEALNALQHAESEHIDPLTLNQKLFLVTPYYVPAVVTGAVTIACIIGATSVQTRRHAALVSAYTLSEKAMTEYQEKVREHLTDSKEQKIRDEVAQDTVKENPPVNSQVIITGAGDQLFYDTRSGRYFESTVDKVRRAENETNAQILGQDYASLNDFYERLDLQQTDVGEELGWRSPDLLTIDISATLLDDGRACLVMGFRGKLVVNYFREG